MTTTFEHSLNENEMKEKHDRFAWAADIMKIKPADVILEVGCGVGMAVEEITSRLRTGKIVAIDRSDKMIQTAVKRNHDAVIQGKAEFLKIDLLHFAKTDLRFNKILFFNINLFWTQKSIAREAALMKSLLTKNGMVHIFYGPMVASGLSKIKETVVSNLTIENFNVNEIIYDEDTNCCCFVCKL